MGRGKNLIADGAIWYYIVTHTGAVGGMMANPVNAPGREHVGIVVEVISRMAGGPLPGWPCAGSVHESQELEV